MAEYGRMSLNAKLNKYYSKWAWQWDVMLSGNPAVDIWCGIRIGRGVGEEEKEVLRGFVDRNQKKPTEEGGLIDMVVSRYGSISQTGTGPREDFSSKGTGKMPSLGDGCIFRGVGNVSSECIRDIAEWVSHWAQHGDNVFRISGRKTRRKKKPPTVELNVGETITSNPTISQNTIDEMISVPAVLEVPVGKNATQNDGSNVPVKADSLQTISEVVSKPKDEVVKNQPPLITASPKAVKRSSLLSSLPGTPRLVGRDEIKSTDVDGKEHVTGINTGKLMMGGSYPRYIFSVGLLP